MTQAGSDFDLIVVGAGPAGLSAATEAARHGLRACVLDEQPALGGQIYRATTTTPIDAESILGKEYGRGASLVREFDESNSAYIRAATVCDVTQDRWVGYQADGRIKYIHADTIVLATGAQERPFPIPGWTLPGVMTAGAAQIMLKSSGAAPSRRTVLAGTGPLLYLLAWQLIRAGRAPACILDTTPRRRYFEAIPSLPGALRHLSYLLKGLRLISGIKRAGVPFIRGVENLRAEGEELLAAVAYTKGGRAHRLECDLLLLHQGVMPSIQITQALRCRHDWDDIQLSFRPRLDAWGQTSEDGIYVAGDGAGIGGAMAAEFRGRLVGLAIAERLGRLPAEKRDALAVPVRKSLEKELAIRPFLDVLYRPAEAQRIPQAPETIVCRCEEITVQQVRDAVALGCPGPNQLKAFVRSGMGPCQGRLCGTTVTEVIAEARGISPGEVGYYRLRAPIKPMRLDELATMELPVRCGDAPAVHSLHADDNR